MKFVIEWVDDENSIYYIEDEFGNRTEVGYWNYDDSGSSGRESVEDFMHGVSKVLDMRIEFEERTHDE